MPVRFQVTEAGRHAWESQDTGVPADYRLILWLLDSAEERVLKHVHS